MRYLFFFILLILVSCSTTKKIYVCGDRPCVDKKEFKEYFAENLIIEILPQKRKKSSSIDLILLNTKKSNNIKKKKILIINDEKLNKKEQKIFLKAEKLRLKKERRIKKNKIREDIKITKLKLKQKKKDNIINYNALNKKKVLSSISTKEPIKSNITINDKEIKNFESINSNNESSVCKNIKNCDIDKISELLLKKGIDKDFPNITSK